MGCFAAQIVSCEPVVICGPRQHEIDVGRIPDIVAFAKALLFGFLIVAGFLVEIFRIVQILDIGDPVFLGLSDTALET